MHKDYHTMRLKLGNYIDISVDAEAFKASLREAMLESKELCEAVVSVAGHIVAERVQKQAKKRRS